MAAPYPKSPGAPQEAGDLGIHNGEEFKRFPTPDSVGEDGAGKVLEATATASNGQRALWRNKTPLATKGDIMVMSGIPARLPRGSDGEMLVSRDGEVTFKQQYEAPSLFLRSTMKSGVMSAVAHNTLTTHTFGTAFAIIPQVVAIFGEDPGDTVERIWVEQITTTGFKVQFKLAVNTDAHDLIWIATRMGDV